MPVRYVFDKPYQILILSRNDWSIVPMHPSSVWCTDDSKMDKSTGACCPDEDLRSLGKFPTVFLAEV